MKTDYPVECSKLSKVTHFNYSCRTVSHGVVLVTIIKVKLLSRSLMKLKKIRSQHYCYSLNFILLLLAILQCLTGHTPSSVGFTPEVISDSEELHKNKNRDKSRRDSVQLDPPVHSAYIDSYLCSL